jgi:hypothetical protein
MQTGLFYCREVREIEELLCETYQLSQANLKIKFPEHLFREDCLAFLLDMAEGTVGSC